MEERQESQRLAMPFAGDIGSTVVSPEQDLSGAGSEQAREEEAGMREGGRSFSGAVARFPRRAGLTAKFLVTSVASSLSERRFPGVHGASGAGGERGPESAQAPVGLHVAGGVAVITLKRADKLNAISAAMWTEIARLTRGVSRSEHVRVIVFRGEGGNFSAGSDLKEMGIATLEEAEDIFHLAEETVAAIEESPLPTVACIPGYALGTGLLLALACDLRVASEEARLGMPMARLGITLSEPFVKRLAALIGPSRTKDLVYTGRSISGEEAYRWGLTDRKVPSGDSTLGECMNIARAARNQSRASLRAAKRWSGSGSGRVPAAYNYVDPQEFPEGVRAFLDRRVPSFAWGAGSGDDVGEVQPGARLTRVLERRRRGRS